MRILKLRRDLCRVLLLCALALSGCGFSPDGEGDGDDEDAGSDEGGSGRGGDGDGTLAITACSDSDPRDPLEIRAGGIEGDELSLWVEHFGGCTRHVYGMCHADWVDGDPPSVALTVTHDAKSDACESVVSEQLFFDLRPLAEQFAERFGERAGTIELVLLGVLKHEYSFDLDAN